MLEISTKALWWITAIMVACRVFDALNGPIMGVIVDNTKSRHGKYKPWIAIGSFCIWTCNDSAFLDFGLILSKYIVSVRCYLFFSWQFHLYN